MEFLRELFTAPLSFEAFQEAVNKKGYKLADLSTGNYVGKEKHEKALNDLKEARDTIQTMTTEAITAVVFLRSESEVRKG